MQGFEEVSPGVFYRDPKMKRKQPYTKSKQATKKRKTSNLAFQKNTVSSSNSPEKKDILGALPTSPVIVSPTFSAATLLNGSLQGAGAGQHIGRKTTMTSLFIRYDLHLQSTSTRGCQVRILVVYDKQANKALPAITDVLTSDNFNAPMNLDNADRFIILVDKLTKPISINNNYNIADTIYKKMALDTLWDTGSNVGDVTDIKTGSVVSFISQSGEVAVAAPLLDSITRIRYTDN